MNIIRRIVISSAAMLVIACSTAKSEFGVYRQSDGTVGVHAPKSATDTEAHTLAEQECMRLGKRTATVIESRKTVNDRFPTTYIYLCK